MGLNGRPLAPQLSAAEAIDRALPMVQPVQPQPVPMNVSFGQAQTPSGMLVVMRIDTPMGTAVYFLPADLARRVGVELQRLGSAGDLLLPPS